MIGKQKLVVVSSYSNNVRQLTSLYLDTTVYSSFQKFEEYIKDSPLDISDLIISSIELPYSNRNMEKMLNIVSSKYIFISGNVYYLVTDKEVKDKVDLVLQKNNIDNIVCLVLESLYEKDILDVIQGKVFTQKDTIVEVKTYRIKATDYERVVNKISDNDLRFENDDETLSDIEDIQPEDIVISTSDRLCTVKTIASNDVKTNAIWSVLNAQYLAISSKVLMLESDVEYHTTLDYLFRSGVEFSFYDIKDIYRDVSQFFNKVKADVNRLIFIGTKSRLKYTYSVLFDLLYYNLRYNFDYMIKNIPFIQLSKAVKTEIVVESTVPDVLKASEDLVFSNNFRYIALNMNDYEGVSLCSEEFKSLMEQLLKVNGINAHAVNIKGLRLVNGGDVNGLLSKD